MFDNNDLLFNQEIDMIKIKPILSHIKEVFSQQVSKSAQAMVLMSMIAKPYACWTCDLDITTAGFSS